MPAHETTKIVFLMFRRVFDGHTKPGRRVPPPRANRIHRHSIGGTGVVDLAVGRAGGSGYNNKTDPGGYPVELTYARAPPSPPPPPPFMCAYACEHFRRPPRHPLVRRACVLARSRARV